jgi:LacI family transcriptional regulator
MPVLLMNGGVPTDGRPSIVVDNHGGAVAAVEHLIAIGRKRIAHIAGPAGNLEAEARLAGYLEAMAKAGLPTMVVDGTFTKASGQAAGEKLVGRTDRPDAVFAANDNMAVGALLAFQDAGFRVPEDIAMVGFDDIPLAGLVRPGLTTLKINIAETGRNALERLVRLIGTAADTACEVVRPELVVRASSNPLISPSGLSGAASDNKQTLSLEGEKL